MKPKIAAAFVVVTFSLALAVPVYVAFRDDRRDRSAYVGWRSGDLVYEFSARFIGWRFSIRLDVPRRGYVSISDPNAWRTRTIRSPGSYGPDGDFDAGFDSYPLGSRGVAIGEEPQWLGFGGGQAPTGVESRVYTVWMPAWFVAAVLALPGLRWIAHRGRAFRRMREGRCSACGYDLRGAWHERCPECGAAAFTRPEPAACRPAEAPRPASGPP